MNKKLITKIVAGVVSACGFGLTAWCLKLKKDNKKLKHQRDIEHAANVLGEVLITAQNVRIEELTEQLEKANSQTKKKS